MELAIETEGLRRTFGDLVAVDGIHLAVPKGAFYGFLGPNGAGKSTTIKVLTGLLRPTAGTMRILGMDPIADPVAAALAVLLGGAQIAIALDDPDKAQKMIRKQAGESDFDFLGRVARENAWPRPELPR